jgi:hypothetical protein
MALIPSRAIRLFVPDAETESEFLLAVTKISVKAYRRAHPIPRFSPTPHDALEHLPIKTLA